MKSDKARWLRIVTAQFEVNDFVSLNLKVVSHQLRKVAQVSLFKIEGIVGDPFDILSEEVIDNTG